MNDEDNSNHKLDFKKVIAAVYNTNPAKVNLGEFSITIEPLAILDRLLFLVEAMLTIYFKPLVVANREVYEKFSLFMGIIHELITAV